MRYFRTAPVAGWRAHPGPRWEERVVTARQPQPLYHGEGAGGDLPGCMAAVACQIEAAPELRLGAHGTNGDQRHRLAMVGRHVDSPAKNRTGMWSG